MIKQFRIILALGMATGLVIWSQTSVGGQELRRPSAMVGLQAGRSNALLLALATQAVTATVEVGPSNSFAFSPTIQIVNVGDAVDWVWSSTFITHSTTSGSCPGGICTPDGAWDSGQHSAPFDFSHTFMAPGTYTYYCSIHGAFMQGTIIAQAKLFLPLILK